MYYILETLKEAYCTDRITVMHPLETTVPRKCPNWNWKRERSCFTPLSPHTSEVSETSEVYGSLMGADKWSSILAHPANTKPILLSRPGIVLLVDSLWRPCLHNLAHLPGIDTESPRESAL